MPEYYWIIGSVSLAVTLAYTAMLIFFSYGWLRRIRTASNEREAHEKITVLLPVRNEATYLACCLQHLLRQDYPDYEIVIADDHSTDDTARIAQRYEKQYPDRIRYLAPDSQHEGKKAALRSAMNKASGTIIVCTDADSTAPPTWLRTLSRPFASQNVHLVAGPVAIKSGGGFFSLLQRLDLLALVASSTGAARAGRPFMCNGTNLAFRKKTGLQLHERLPGKDYASGDDVFLLHAVKKAFPGSVVFLKNREVLVQTEACKTLREFVAQRLRWAGKATAYRDGFSQMVAWCAGLQNLWLWVAVALAILNPAVLGWMVAIFAVKMLADFFLLMLAVHKWNLRKDLWLFPVAFLFHTLYVPLIGLLAPFATVTWKGRKI